MKTNYRVTDVSNRGFASVKLLVLSTLALPGLARTARGRRPEPALAFPPTCADGRTHRRDPGALVHRICPALLRRTLAATVALTLIGEVLAAGPELEDMFLPATGPAPAQVSPDPPHALRSRRVTLNSRLLRAGPGSLREPGARWKAGLFGDTELVIRLTQADLKAEDRFVSIGQVEGVPGSQAILAVTDGMMVGNFTVPGRGVFQVEYAGNGVHRIIQADPAHRPPCGQELLRQRGILSPALEAAEPAVEEADAEAAPPAWSPVGRAPRPHGPETSEPVTIDLLVLYTSKARAGAGGEAGIQALIDFCTAEANSAFANSRIAARLNVVHHETITYAETGDLFADRTWLANSSTVNSLRSAWAADLVLMMVEHDNSGWGGVAYDQGSVFVRHFVNAGMYLVSHELAHLFGAGHDRVTCAEYPPGNCGARFSYSYGHRFEAEGKTYITIMSYVPGVWIPHFSNPEVSFLGVPTGVAAGTPDAADNARTINQTAPSVAAYRNAAIRYELDVGTLTLAESAGTVTLRVLRTGDTNAPSAVRARTAAGTASTTDYSPFDVVVQFAPGEIEKPLVVHLLDDDLAEGPEQFAVILSPSSTRTALNSPNQTLITLLDDEPVLRFAQSDLLVRESDAGTPVRVQRLGRTDQPASVRFAVTGGTASEGADFAPTGGRVEFGPGETEKTIPFAPVNDDLIEPDETCVLTLSDPLGAALAAPAALTIRLADEQRPGSLDPAFPREVVFNDRVAALAVRPDGRILCAGWFTDPGGLRRAAVVQYLPDGNLDPAFPPVPIRHLYSDELASETAFVARLRVLEDGRVLVAGEFTAVGNHRTHHVARLLPNGTPDVTFTASPGPDGWVYDLLELSDGRLLICGTFRNVSGWSSGLVARLHADGTVDHSFQAEPRAQSMYASTLAVEADGRIWVGGFLTGFGNVGRQGLAGLLPDGSPDPQFRSLGLNGAVARLALTPQGLVVAGLFTSPRPKLFRLRADGSRDPSFDPAPALNGQVRDLLVQPDGTLIIAGEFLSTPTQNQNRIARLLPNGAVDTSFNAGTGPNDTVWCVAAQPDGHLVIGGSFTSVNGFPRTALARLRSDGTRPTFAPPRQLTPDLVQLRLLGNAGQTYRLERSSDLTLWVPVRTQTLTGTSWEWTENTTAAERQFYRIVVP